MDNNNNEVIRSSTPASLVKIGSVGNVERLQTVTPLSKVLAAIIFITMPFIGGYIGYTYAPEPTLPEPSVKMLSDSLETSVSMVSEGKNSSSSLPNQTTGLVKFVDTEIGFSFMHPAELGAIEVDEEFGDCFPTPESPERKNISGDSCRMLSYSFAGSADKKTFLVAETKGHQSNPVGRGGFWGDGAGAISDTYLERCTAQSKCIPVTSDNGVTFAKFDDYLAAGYKSVITDEYRLFNSESEFNGMIISPYAYAVETDPENADVPDEIEKIFADTLIKTFKFE